jgi:hypothetical protein
MKRSIHYPAAAALVLFASAAFAQTSPSEKPQTPAVTTPGETNPKAPVPGKNSFTEEQAKQRLTDEGYTEIMNLELSEDAIWLAEAMRDRQPFKVQLDYQGNITTR